MPDKIILLSAGGTGGHVFPARALAEILLDQGYQVVLATDARGQKYFKGLDIPQHIIDSGGYLPGLKGKIRAVLGLVKGYIQSHKIISQLKPSAVIGFGGYPSAPPLFAAQHRGIPTILHEQNAILGLANILLAGQAKRIALSFTQTEKIKAAWQSKCSFVGNPVRADIAELGKQEYVIPQHHINLLVVGGSQGAKIFGSIIPQAIAGLEAGLRSRLSVAHQARPEDIDKVREIYQGSGINLDLRSFFDDMPRQIARAHLLVTRSGASTVAEVTAAGRPAIFIPFPWNRDLQQVFNAQGVVKAGGGWMILEQDLTVEALQKALVFALSEPEILRNAATNALKLGQPDAARKLADIVAEFH